MAVKLLAINDVYNIREAKYIVDEENEKDLIPEEDKVQGTRVLVIKGSKEYRMDSNKNWVLIKGEGGDSLPDVSSTDNGKVLGVVNGEWDKMTPSGGTDEPFFLKIHIDSGSSIDSIKMGENEETVTLEDLEGRWSNLDYVYVTSVAGDSFEGKPYYVSENHSGEDNVIFEVLYSIGESAYSNSVISFRTDIMYVEGYNYTSTYRHQVTGVPPVTASDNGKVLGVVNGAWDKMNAPGGGDDIFVISATINEGDYDPVTDTYPYVVTPDKTPEEVASAIRDGKYLIVNVYNTASNVSYIMSCITNNIVDGDNGYCRATAEFVASGRSILSVRQTRSLKQYTVSFEYQHPTNGSGSEPTVSWSFNEVTGFVNVNDKYYADIKISTEQITSSTTYTIESGTDQVVASQKAKTGDLIITLYYGSYSSEPKIYNVINCYTAPSNIINKKKIYFDVIDTLDTTTTQLKLHKLCWDGDDTITHVGSYSIPIPALPNVSSSDNGKVLGVVNGAWDKIDAPDGDFIITILYNKDTTDPQNPVITLTPDKTDAEIIAAIEAGMQLVVRKSEPSQWGDYFEEFRLTYMSYEPDEDGVYISATFNNKITSTSDTDIHVHEDTFTYTASLYDPGDVGTWAIYTDEYYVPVGKQYFVRIDANGTITNDSTTYSTTQSLDRVKNNVSSMYINIYYSWNASNILKWQATNLTRSSNTLYFDVPYIETSGSTQTPMIRSFVWDSNGIRSTGKMSAGGDPLPTVTTSDSGSVLQVNSSGAWVKGIKIQEHDYTVTYADGTTATLKNVEVV